MALRPDPTRSEQDEHQHQRARRGRRAHQPLPTIPHHERRWLALGVILIAQMMLLLDATIVNVALPSMQADLGFSDDARGWVVTAYLLAFGSLLLLGGRLADAFGRKNVFIVGLVGFAIASAVAGAAPNIATLITARAVQGGFAAVMAPAALSLIMIIFTDLKGAQQGVRDLRCRRRELLGGRPDAGWGADRLRQLALDHVRQRRVRGRRDRRRPRAAAQLHRDRQAQALGAEHDPRDGGVFGVVFGASKAETDGWGAAITLIPLIAGGLLLIVFVAFQKIDRHPLVPLRVVADRNRGAAS